MPTVSLGIFFFIIEFFSIDLCLPFRFVSLHSDHLQGTPARLTVPVLSPCLRAEQIHITVDTHTGMLRCHVPKHLDCSVVPELQSALNFDLNKLQLLVSELRYWITKRRCEKTLQHLPATPHQRLPLLHATDHPIAKIGRHKVYVKLHRQTNIILVSASDTNSTPSFSIDLNVLLSEFVDCGAQGEARQSMRDGI